MSDEKVVYDISADIQRRIYCMLSDAQDMTNSNEDAANLLLHYCQILGFMGSKLMEDPKQNKEITTILSRKKPSPRRDFETVVKESLGFLVVNKKEKPIGYARRKDQYVLSIKRTKHTKKDHQTYSYSRKIQEIQNISMENLLIENQSHNGIEYILKDAKASQGGHEFTDRTVRDITMEAEKCIDDKELQQNISNWNIPGMGDTRNQIVQRSGRKDEINIEFQQIPQYVNQRIAGHVINLREKLLDMIFNYEQQKSEETLLDENTVNKEQANNPLPILLPQIMEPIKFTERGTIENATAEMVDYFNRTLDRVLKLRNVGKLVHEKLYMNSINLYNAIEKYKDIHEQLRMDSASAHLAIMKTIAIQRGESTFTELNIIYNRGKFISTLQAASNTGLDYFLKSDVRIYNEILKSAKRYSILKYLTTEVITYRKKLLERRKHLVIAVDLPASVYLPEDQLEVPNDSIGEESNIPDDLPQDAVPISLDIPEDISKVPNGLAQDDVPHSLRSLTARPENRLVAPDVDELPKYEVVSIYQNLV
ncbi:hypothetical protein HDV02_005171, partial [Globomyces sp. JEL0801]